MNNECLYFTIPFSPLLTQPHQSDLSSGTVSSHVYTEKLKSLNISI